ncbi:unnamed protein product [Lathyrus oleraceus]
MKFPYISIFISLMSLALVSTHAALPSELYWKSKLPTTQMPKAITDLLNSTGNGKVNGTSNSGYPFFYYGYAANKSQLHDNPNVGLFFLKKDLHHGTKFNMQFTKTSKYGASFLSKQVATSIPFSSNKLKNILNHFSIKNGSYESEFVKNTITVCEMPAIKGEEKLCVTSLESMVDFTASKLGNNVEAVSTEVKNESSVLQEYVIAKGVKRLGEKNKSVVCHKVNYPYAVFYCHKTDKTKVYSVILEGVDGNRVKAVAVCHTETTQWSHNHLAFQVLNVQPGTEPVCHFFTQEHVVWISK